MHVDARLVAAALQQVEGQLRQLFPDGRGRLWRGARAEQVREAPAQGRLSVNHWSSPRTGGTRLICMRTHHKCACNSRGSKFIILRSERPREASAFAPIRM